MCILKCGVFLSDYPLPLTFKRLKIKGKGKVRMNAHLRLSLVS